MRVLEHIAPEDVFYYFEEISKIPRGSGNMEGISSYLLSFGKNLGFETIRDQDKNVYIRKPASPGKENLPGVILQGHMDMVCEKEEDSDHDFEKDGIELLVEDGFLKAKGTTLGADDGIGIAMIMAILSDQDLSSPQIEALFTTDEETSMLGAKGLSKDLLKGKYLINIDSEEEGKILAGCAGGENIILTYPLEREDVGDSIFLEIKIKNLKGGHSGTEISKVLGNAIKYLAQVLHDLLDFEGLDLISIEGGSKHNAIPRSASAILALDPAVKGDFEGAFEKIRKSLLEKHLTREPDMDLQLDWLSDLDHKGVIRNSERICGLLEMLPHGVYSMIDNRDVETSDNLAIIETHEDHISVELSIRGSNPEKFKELEENIREISDIYKCGFDIYSSYPGWEYERESPLRNHMIKVYKEIFDENIKIEVIHAGLECGLIKEKYPDLDMCSIGPDLIGAHSPEERLSIDSTERAYRYLRMVLEAF